MKRLYLVRALGLLCVLSLLSGCVCDKVMDGLGEELKRSTEVTSEIAKKHKVLGRIAISVKNGTKTITVRFDDTPQARAVPRASIEAIVRKRFPNGGIEIAFQSK